MRLPSDPRRRSSRNALGLAAVALGALGLSWGLAFGCSFPDYTTSTGEDSSTDLGVDTAPDAPVCVGPYILTDGRACTGHDEDGDCVPDECDNCPNIANPGLAGKDVGDACASSMLGFATRLALDPFTSFSGWQYYGSTTGAFQLAPDGDSIIGGSLSTGSTPDPDLRFIAGPTGNGPGSAGVALTAIVTIQAEDPIANLPSAGLLARVNGTTGKEFFLCGVSTSVGFVLARTDAANPCDGGACNPLLIPLEAGSSQAAFPSDVPHAIGQQIGIRITITGASGDAGTTSGDIECRVFNPLVPSTLQSTDPKYAIRATLPTSRWIASGDVGAYAIRSKIQIHSMDILKGP
jgi:hypothetical protein